MKDSPMNLKTKTVCVVDNGLFVSFARKIAPAFKKVWYYTPWQSSFPTSKQVAVGQGFEEIERTNFPLAKADEIDLWVFLDVNHWDLQLFLEDHGARVWGGRQGEELELKRWNFKQWLRKVGLPVGVCERVVGDEALKKELKARSDLYVKTSFVRGDFETFHHETMDLTAPRLDEILYQLGPVKEEYEFILEDPIENAVEVGYDGFSVDGQFPDCGMLAYEVKDCGIVGATLPVAKLSKPVLEVNKAIGPALKGYRYRGFLSTEIRYSKDKKPYFIDPCCRLGTPSNELLQELFEGWPETLWEGAEGKLVSPKPIAKFGVMATICSEWAVENWQAVHYPKELERWVKLRNHTRIGGMDYIPPQPVGLPDLGGVVGTGDTLIDAVKACVERAGQVKGYQVRVDLESIGKALEVIKKGQEAGIYFGEGLPTAEAVQRVVTKRA